MVTDIQTFLRHLLDWTGAVMRAWWGYASFIIAGVIVATHDKIAAIPFTFSDLEVPLAVGLPFAFFQVWRTQRIEAEANAAALRIAEGTILDQRRELGTTTSTLISTRLELDQERERNTPNLAGEIVAYTGGGSSTQPGFPEGLTLMLTVTIRNLPPGAASIADKYILWLADDPQSIRYAPYMFLNAVSMYALNGIGDVYDPSDWIFNKTSGPIPTGGSRTGNLFFILPVELAETFVGRTVVVEFQDVLSNRYTMQRVIEKSSGRTENLYFPGTKLAPAPREAANRRDVAAEPSRPLRPGEKGLPMQAAD